MGQGQLPEFLQTTPAPIKDADIPAFLKKKEEPKPSVDLSSVGGNVSVSGGKVGASAIPSTTSKSNLGLIGDLSKIEEYNKGFESQTGYANRKLFDPVKPDGDKFFRSEYDQKKYERRQRENFLAYQDAEKDINTVLGGVNIGIVKPEELKTLKEKPYGKKIVEGLIREFDPQQSPTVYDKEVFGNEQRWDALAKRVNAQNRPKGVELQNQQITDWDNQISSFSDNFSLGSISGTTGVMRSFDFDKIDPNDPVSISDALNKVQSAQFILDKDRKMNVLERDNIQKALNNKLAHIVSEKGVDPEVDALDNDIYEAVENINIDKLRGTPQEAAGTRGYKDLDANVQQFKLGLSFLKYSKPQMYKNIVRAISDKGEIPKIYYRNISELGQDLYNQKVFREGAVNPNMIGAETSLDYKTDEDIKNEYKILIGERAKQQGFENVPEFTKKQIRALGADLENQKIVEDIAIEEQRPFHDAIPKSGAVEAFFGGVAQPLKGIKNTFLNATESPAETFLRSSTVNVGEQRLPSDKGNIFYDVMEGFGQFLPQILLTRTFGAPVSGVATTAVSAVPRAALTAGQATNISNIGGTLISSYLQTYGDDYADALRKTGDPNTARLMATINSTTAAGIESFINPDIKIAQKFVKGLKGELAETIVDLVKKGDASKVTPTIVKFLKGAGKTFGQEIAEEDLTNVGNYVTEAIFSPQTAKDRSLGNELLATTRATALSMAIPALIGGSSEGMRKDFARETLNDAALNFNEYKDALDKALFDGEITKSQYQYGIDAMTLHRGNIEKNQTTDDKPGAEQLDKAVKETESELKQVKETILDQDRDLTDAGEQLSEDQKLLQTAIDNGEVKDVMYVNMAAEAVKSPEAAKELIDMARSQATGEVSGELGTAREGIEKAFGKTIADAVAPVKVEEVGGETEEVFVNKDNVDKYLTHLKEGGKLAPSDLIDLRYVLREKHRLEQDALFDKVKKEGGKHDDAYIYSKNPDSVGRELGKKQKEEMDLVIKQPNSYGLAGDINAPITYHFTDPFSILNILDENSLYGEGEVSGVSTTTNKGLGHPELTTAQQYGKGNKALTFAEKGVRIDLDLQKLREDNIKIKVGNENLGTFEGEEELKIGGYEGIKDLSKYIKQIEVDKKILDEEPVTSPYHVSFEEIKKAAEKHGVKVVEKTDYERPRNRLTPISKSIPTQEVKAEQPTVLGEGGTIKTLQRKANDRYEGLDELPEVETHEKVLGRAKTGTPIEIEALRIQKSDETNKDTGVFFADKGIINEYRARERDGFYGEENKGLFGGDVKKYNLSFTNPLVIKSQVEFIKELADKGDMEAREVLPDWEKEYPLFTNHETYADRDRFVARKARELGHDGIITPLEYIALGDNTFSKNEPLFKEQVEGKPSTTETKPRTEEPSTEVSKEAETVTETGKTDIAQIEKYSAVFKALTKKSQAGQDMALSKIEGVTDEKIKLARAINDNFARIKKELVDKNKIESICP